jgi:hypothetical protein
MAANIAAIVPRTRVMGGQIAMLFSAVVALWMFVRDSAAI